MAALLEVWSDRRLHLAPASAHQRPHLIVAVRAAREGVLPDYGEHLERVRHLTTSIAVVALPEICGDAEQQHLASCKPQRVPLLMEAAQALHQAVARCVAAVPRASLVRPAELANIVRHTLDHMYAEPAFQPANLRQQIIATRHAEWSRTHQAQFKEAVALLITNPYHAPNAAAEIQQLTDTWQHAFNQEWSRPYGEPADADILKCIRQAHNDDTARMAAATHRDVLAAQNRQQLAVCAAAVALLAAAHVSLQLTSASRELVNTPMNQAMGAAHAQFDHDTQSLRHPCKADKQLALTREFLRLVQLAWGNLWLLYPFSLRPFSSSFPPSSASSRPL